MVSTDTRKKYEKLQAILSSMGSVVVGFSGGVDSTFLTCAAHQALGNKVLAVTAVSATSRGAKPLTLRLWRNSSAWNTGWSIRRSLKIKIRRQSAGTLLLLQENPLYGPGQSGQG